MSDFKNPWDNNNKKSDDELDELIRKSRKKIMDFLDRKRGQSGGSKGMGNFPHNLFSTIGILLFIILLLGWLSTGFYAIRPDEEGVILRLGKYQRTSMPGLNFKLPDPIETLNRVSVTTINKEIIGYRSKSSLARAALLTSTENYTNSNDSKIENITEESLMLTGDENMVNINFDVQWRIKDAKSYLFNLRDLSDENTVKTCAESVMREVIGVQKISDVLAGERANIEQRAKKLLQNMLDGYKFGVEVVRVQMLAVQPPDKVIAAYSDVQTAKSDRDKVINQAYAHRNSVIPKARGEAEKTIKEAEAFKQEAIERSKGEAARFESIFMQYQSAQEITYKRLYLETMEEILSGMDKIIMDTNASGNTVPYLSLQELLNKKSFPNTDK